MAHRIAELDQNQDVAPDNSISTKRVKSDGDKCPDDAEAYLGEANDAEAHLGEAGDGNLQVPREQPFVGVSFFLLFFSLFR